MFTVIVGDMRQVVRLNNSANKNFHWFIIDAGKKQMSTWVTKEFNGNLERIEMPIPCIERPNELLLRVKVCLTFKKVNTLFYYFLEIKIVQCIYFGRFYIKSNTKVSIFVISYYRQQVLIQLTRKCEKVMDGNYVQQ